MFEFAALTYGVLASIILSAAQRNRKLARPHPPLLLLQLPPPITLAHLLRHTHIVVL